MFKTSDILCKCVCGLGLVLLLGMEAEAAPMARTSSEISAPARLSISEGLVVKAGVYRRTARRTTRRAVRRRVY